MTGAELERLLAEDAWLRRLARSLAGDAATADDLVQETWVAALAAHGASPSPRSPRAVRPWLAGTLRNLWRSRARGEGRRAGRERSSAPREPAQPTDEVVGELVLRRDVVDAVLALDEPERGVLFRRFFKDASLASIAAEDGVAVSTVHARLARGLERIRTRFDAAHGGRSAWMLGLLRAAELAPAPRGSTPGTPAGPGARAGPAEPLGRHVAVRAPDTLLGGALVMTTMIKAAAVVAAVALAGLWWQGRGASAPAAAARGDEAAVLEQRDAPLVPAGAEPAAGEEVAAAPALGRRAAAPAAAPITESSVAATRIQRGRLVDLSGAPLEGVVVRLLARHAAVPSIAVPLEHGAAHEALPHGHPAVGPPAGAPAPDAPADPERLGAARTDGDGVFAIELPASSAERAPIPGMPAHGTPRGYALDDARLMLVLVTADAAGAPLLLAAPRTTLGGTVFDPDGGPLRDAEVQLAVLDTLLRSLGLPYAINLQLPAWTTRTDATGRFRFEGVLGGEHTLISVPWGVHSGAVLTPPAHDDLWLELHLRVRDDVLRVVGIVLDASGSPVPGSAVALGDEIDESDADGRFELAWNTAHERSFAEVLAQGFRPRPMPQSHVAAYARGLGVARVELTRELAAEPVVLRLSGAPLAIDGRVVDDRGEPLERVQVWMTDPTHFGSRRETIGAALILHPLSLEEMQVGKRSAVTDANGRFRLEGLLDRSYSVQAFDPRTHSFGPGWTIAAGATGVELALATESSATRVAGRLVSRGGRPLAGVGVHPVRRADRPELEWPPLQGAGRETTDSDGRFEFPELAAEGTRLTVFGGPELGYLVEHYALADFPDPERIEIVLPLSCELQVVLSDPATADAARALDADGNALSVIESHGTFTMMPDVVRIVAGRSAVVSVSELARELVLLRGGAEVVRLPLRVDPDRRTTVEY